MANTDSSFLTCKIDIIWKRITEWHIITSHSYQKDITFSSPYVHYNMTNENVPNDAQINIKSPFIIFKYSNIEGCPKCASQISANSTNFVPLYFHLARCERCNVEPVYSCCSVGQRGANSRCHTYTPFKHTPYIYRKCIPIYTTLAERARLHYKINA